MAAQRITIAKVGGLAAEGALRRLREWAGARRGVDPGEWSGEQWTPGVRAEVDAFAERLRAGALVPPVVHFVEWSDLWSMGDLFGRWLTPPGGPPPLIIHGDRYQVYGYALPDGGRLGRHLAAAGPQPFPESDWFVGRLHEAVNAWQEWADPAAILVLRQVVGGLYTDEEIRVSLSVVPDWLSDEVGGGPSAVQRDRDVLSASSGTDAGHSIPDRMDRDWHELLMAFGTCHRLLTDHARAIRGRPGVEGVTHRLEMYDLDGGFRLEEFVDAELSSGEAISWRLEMTISPGVFRLESDVRRIHREGQDLRAEIADCRWTTPTESAMGLIEATRRLCSTDPLSG